jgi:hypothetical protein
MKCFLALGAIAVSISCALAGSERYSAKETIAPPCPSWYADNEWNVSLWAEYAFTANDYPTGDDTVFLEGGRPLNPPFSGRHPNTYLEADHAWGGGIDIKYFFNRYFGIGIQGFALNARRSFGTVTISAPPPGFVGSRVEVGTRHDERMVGSVLGTFTLRYPMGCSRFAPYLWFGGGMISGGGERDIIIVHDIPSGAFLSRISAGSQTKAIGQFGAGFEVRLTPHIGLTNDFSWNVIDGNNDFGMARTGINFAF